MRNTPSVRARSSSCCATNIGSSRGLGVNDRVSLIDRGMELLRRKVLRHLLIDRGDFRQTVLVAGSGRSGTTWVQEIINHRGSYRVVFEPFHPKKIGALSQWKERQYLRPENDSARFLGPAGDILSGRIRNEWVDQHNRRLIAGKRIVKDIRTNLSLRWIKEHFPEVPIVLVLRHPCAVASSQLKGGMGR